MPIKPLAGKTALVTGACGGIGSAIAQRLAQDGALVVVHYGSTKEAGERIVSAIREQGGTAFSVTADISSTNEIKHMFNFINSRLNELCGHSRLDILVNNAGINAPFGPVSSFSEKDFDQLFNVNFKGPFFVTQNAIPTLSDGGHIINISSISSKGASPMLAAYAASKSPLNSLTKSLAIELAPRKISVNAVLPGLVLTNLTNEVKSNPDLLMKSIKSIPFGRVGEAEDIANIISSLVNNDFKWVTGQLIEATGGANL